MDDLKLCPLCNCMASVINVPAASLCHIECLHCGLKTRTFYNKAGMLEYWNARPTADNARQDAEIARLKEEVRRWKATSDDHFRNAERLARALTGSQSHD